MWRRVIMSGMKHYVMWEMDCISVFKTMIDARGEGDHVMFLILIMCYILSITYAPIS